MLILFSTKSLLENRGGAKCPIWNQLSKLGEWVGSCPGHHKSMSEVLSEPKWLHATHPHTFLLTLPSGLFQRELGGIFGPVLQMNGFSGAPSSTAEPREPLGPALPCLCRGNAPQRQCSVFLCQDQPLAVSGLFTKPKLLVFGFEITTIPL